MYFLIEQIPLCFDFEFISHLLGYMAKVDILYEFRPILCFHILMRLVNL
jgi:hypothetical protein